MTRFLSLLALSALALVLSLAAAPAGAAKDPAPDLIMSACTKCHTTARICRNLPQDSKWWTATVGRMAGKGAAVSPNQQEIVAQYLAQAPAGTSPPCP